MKDGKEKNEKQCIKNSDMKKKRKIERKLQEKKEDT